MGSPIVAVTFKTILQANEHGCHGCHAAGSSPLRALVCICGFSIASTLANAEDIRNYLHNLPALGGERIREAVE
jgi:hypothetical protein